MVNFHYERLTLQGCTVRLLQYSENVTNISSVTTVDTYTIVLFPYDCVTTYNHSPASTPPKPVCSISTKAVISAKQIVHPAT